MNVTLQQLIDQQANREQEGAGSYENRIALCQAEQLSRIADVLEKLLAMAEKQV